MLQHVAACCSMLQRVVACCSVLQHVAACCSVLQRVAACCSVLQYVAACCSVLQCAAVQCSALETPTLIDGPRQVCTSTFSTLQHTETHCNTLQQKCSPRLFLQTPWGSLSSHRLFNCGVSFMKMHHFVVCERRIGTKFGEMSTRPSTRCNIRRAL